MSILRIVIYWLVTSILLMGVIACSSDVEPTTKAITVVITEPVADSFVRASRFRVRGEASGTSVITVDGQSVDVIGGRWETVVERGEGATTVLAKAGDIGDSVNFFVDSIAPSLELTQPARAIMRDSEESNALVFQGSVHDDGSGLWLLKINETIIYPDDNGAFESVFELVSGLNVVSITALDKANNETTIYRAAIYGPLVDPSQLMTSAFGMHIPDNTLKDVGNVLSETLTPERVARFVETSFGDNESISIDSIAFDPVAMTVSPQDGYLGFHLVVDNLIVHGDFTINNETYPAYVGVRHVELELDVALHATENGSISAEVVRSRLTLNENDIESDLIEESDVLRSIVQTLVETAFSEFVSTAMIEQLYDPGLLNRKIEILGRALEFKILVENIRINRGGIYVSTSVEVPEQQFAQVPEVPGALNHALGLPGSTTVQGYTSFNTNRTVLDRLAHSVWSSGLLNQQLRGNDFAGSELPFELTADSLATIFDNRIRNYADNHVPAGISLRPQLPPVFKFNPDTTDEASGNKAGLTLQIAELLVDIELLHPDKAHEKLITLALFLDLDIDIDLDNTDVFLDFDVSARLDIAEEPLFDFDDASVKTLILELVRLIPEVLATNLVIQAEAQLPWVTLRSPELRIEGMEHDGLVVGVEAIPNPDGIDTVLFGDTE